MSDPFSVALEHLMGREGGYVDNPADRGGPTKFGITLNTLGEFRAPIQVCAQDLKNLSRQEAGHIYRDLYWDKMGLDSVKDKKTALILFDYGVHAGPVTAVKLLQSTMNRDFWFSLTVDGKLGHRTIESLYHVNRTKLNRKLIQGIQAHYARICAADPSQVVFLEGWLNRTFALMDQRDGFSVFSFF